MGAGERGSEGESQAERGPGPFLPRRTQHLAKVDSEG